MGANTVTITLDRYNELLELEKAADDSMSFSILLGDSNTEVKTNDSVIAHLNEMLEDEQDQRKRLTIASKDLRELKEQIYEYNRLNEVEIRKLREELDSKNAVLQDNRRRADRIKSMLKNVPNRAFRKYNLTDVAFEANRI